MKKHLLLAFAAISSILFFSACEKEDDDHNQGTTGSVTLEFEHGWGPLYESWTLGQEKIHPMTGDTITFTQLRYYVTNLKLQKTDGTWWVQPESYHIVNAANSAESALKLQNVPAGEYKALYFMLGVDSLHNVSGAQTGALSSTHGMFWDWFTGYIQVRAEGNSPQSSTGKFLYHLGGFSGELNTIQEKTVTFGATMLNAAPGAAPVIHMKVNTARFWHGGLKIKDISLIHAPSTQAATMAKNYGDGFMFDHIHQ